MCAKTGALGTLELSQWLLRAVGYPASLRIAAAAVWHCSRVTSRCVTARITFWPSAATSTPSAFSRSATSFAVPSRASTSNQTRFVSTSRRDERQPRHVRDRLGDHLGVGVVLGQPVDVVVQRVQARGGEEAGLPHRRRRTACGCAGPCAIRSFGPSSAEPTGAPEPLAEADRDGVERARPTPPRGRRSRPSRSRGGRRRGASPARSSAPSSQIAWIASSGVDRAAAAVVRVLQADEPGADGVHVVRADLAFEVGDVEQPVVAVDRAAGDAAERRRAAGFPEVDVAGRFEEDFVLRPAVDADRDLVRHRARWDEQRRLLAEAAPRRGAPVR